MPCNKTVFFTVCLNPPTEYYAYFRNKFLKVHGGNELCDRSKVKGGRKKYIYIYYTHVKCIFFVDSYLFYFWFN